MKVLITGGCGFLGSNLAASYLKDGAEVVVIDALFRRGSALNLAWLESLNSSSRFHFVQADLADTESVFSIFRRYAPFYMPCRWSGKMTTSCKIHWGYANECCWHL